MFKLKSLIQSSFLFALLAICANGNLFAQEYKAEVHDTYSSEIGVFAGLRAGVNVQTAPVMRQNSFGFASVPEFGARFIYPLSKTQKVGLLADMSYSTYSYVIQDYGKGDKYAHSYSYLCFSPNILFEGMTIGFKIGVPMSAEMEGTSIASDSLSTLTELNIGYLHEFYKDPSGAFYMGINVGYMLTGIYKDFLQADPLKKTIPLIPAQATNNSFNHRAASLSLTFTYLFKL
jgi:hypothetical protein